MSAPAAPAERTLVAVRNVTGRSCSFLHAAYAGDAKTICGRRAQDWRLDGAGNEVDRTADVRALVTCGNCLRVLCRTERALTRGTYHVFTNLSGTRRVCATYWYGTTRQSCTDRPLTDLLDRPDCLDVDGDVVDCPLCRHRKRMGLAR